MDRITEIYFNDLSDSGKRKILAHYNITSPEEGNLQYSPVFTLVSRLSNWVSQDSKKGGL